MPNSKKNPQKDPKLYKFSAKWQNIAKSGHTARQEGLFQHGKYLINIFNVFVERKR